MSAGQHHRGLTGVAGFPPHGRQQQWATSHGFAGPLRLGAAHKEAPPVVDQRYVARGHLAAQQVLRHKSAPAPWALEFVNGVLPIGPLPIQTGQAHQIPIRIGHQQGIFIGLGRRYFQPQRFGTIGEFSFRSWYPPPPHDHPSLPAPARQGQRLLPGLPTLTAIFPTALPAEWFDQLSAAAALPQSKEIRLEMLRALAVGHEVLEAKAAIPAQQPGPLGRREWLPPRPKSRADRSSDRQGSCSGRRTGKIGLESGKSRCGIIPGCECLTFQDKAPPPRPRERNGPATVLICFFRSATPGLIRASLRSRPSRAAALPTGAWWACDRSTRPAAPTR